MRRRTSVSLMNSSHLQRSIVFSSSVCETQPCFAYSDARSNAYSQLCLLFPIRFRCERIFYTSLQLLFVLCIFNFLFILHTNKQTKKKYKKKVNEQNGNFLHKMCNCVLSGKYCLNRLTKSNGIQNRSEMETIVKMLCIHQFKVEREQKL